MPAITLYTSSPSHVINSIIHGGPSPSSHLGTQIKGAFSSSNEARIQNLEAEIQNIGRFLKKESKTFVASQSSPYPYLKQRKAIELVDKKLAEPTPLSNPELLNSRENLIKVPEYIIERLGNNASPAHAPTLRHPDINKTLKEQPEALVFYVNSGLNAEARATPHQGNNPIDSNTLAVFEEYGKDPVWNCHGFMLENRDNIEASAWTRYSQSYQSWCDLPAENRESQSFKSFALGQQHMTEHEWNHVDTLLTNWKNMPSKEMERLSNLGFTRAMHIDSKIWKGVIEGGKLGKVRDTVIVETADPSKYNNITVGHLADWQVQSREVENAARSIPLIQRVFEWVKGKELSDHQRDFASARGLNFEEIQSVVDKKGDLTKLGKEMFSKLPATLNTKIEKSFLDDPSVLPRLINNGDLREWEENWEKQCTEPDFFLKCELKVLEIAEKDIETIFSLEKKFENDPSTDQLKKELLANGFSKEVVEGVKDYRDNKPQNTAECIERAAQLFSSMYNLPPYFFLQLVIDNHALVYKGYDREPSRDHRSARQSSAV